MGVCAHADLLCPMEKTENEYSHLDLYRVTLRKEAKAAWYRIKYQIPNSMT